MKNSDINSKHPQKANSHFTAKQKSTQQQNVENLGLHNGNSKQNQVNHPQASKEQIKQPQKHFESQNQYINNLNSNLSSPIVMSIQKENQYLGSTNRKQLSVMRGFNCNLDANNFSVNGKNYNADEESLVFSHMKEGNTYNQLQRLQAFENLKDNLFDSSICSQSIHQLEDVVDQLMYQHQDHPYETAIDSAKKMARITNPNIMGGDQEQNIHNYYDKVDEVDKFLPDDKRFSKDRYMNPLNTEQEDLYDNIDQQETSQVNMSQNMRNLFAPTPPMLQPQIQVLKDQTQDDKLQSKDDDRLYKMDIFKNELTIKTGLDEMGKNPTQDISFQQKLNMASAKQLGSFQALLGFKQGLLVKHNPNGTKLNQPNEIKSSAVHQNSKENIDYQNITKSFVTTKVDANKNDSIDKKSSSGQPQSFSNKSDKNQKTLICPQSQLDQIKIEPQTLIAKMKNNLSSRNKNNEIVSENSHNNTQENKSGYSHYHSSNESRQTLDPQGALRIIQSNQNDRLKSPSNQSVASPLKVNNNMSQYVQIHSNHPITTTSAMTTDRAFFPSSTRNQSGKQIYLNSRNPSLNHGNLNKNICRTVTIDDQQPIEQVQLQRPLMIAHKKDTQNLRRRTTRQLIRSTSRDKIELQISNSNNNLLSLHQSFDHKKAQANRNLAAFAQRPQSKKRNLSNTGLTNQLANTFSPRSHKDVNQSKSPSSIVRNPQFENLKTEILRLIESSKDQVIIQDQQISNFMLGLFKKYSQTVVNELKMSATHYSNFLADNQLKSSVNLSMFSQETKQQRSKSLSYQQLLKILQKISLQKHFTQVYESHKENSDLNKPTKKVQFVNECFNLLIEQQLKYKKQAMLQPNSSKGNLQLQQAIGNIFNLSTFDQILIEGFNGQKDVINMHSNSKSSEQLGNSNAIKQLLIDPQSRLMLKNYFKDEILRENMNF
ncbi:UNKNOWN [Stylonychia lemnae]|uniref:Uncharacterized protein n=1 Tax=Stylonychia lemnae TaxID=5949 RepID=A0A078A1E3_STYLE|nr:UNKNOWN [Stylonychia lemnae]|eukprot:CDW75662.1 UNKNOWN [Stylonychia lemnae]